MPDSTTEQVLLSLSGMLRPAPAPVPEANTTIAATDNAPATTDFNDKLVPGRPVHMIRTLTLSDAVDEEETLSLLRDTRSTTGQDDGDNPGARRLLARVHVLQLQPTDRPIEDRFSIRLTTRSGASVDPGAHLARPATGTGRSSRTRVRLQLGVYDGHRGSWAAQHVAATLPQRLDDVELASSTAAAGPVLYEGGKSAAAVAGHPEAVEERVISAFQALDDDMLESFTTADSPDLLVSKGGQRRRRLLGLVGLSAKKDQGKEGQDKPNVLDDGLSALRAVSGCTACLLLLDWDLDDLEKEIAQHPASTADVGLAGPRIATAAAARTACRCALINLGDSRAVVADLHNGDRHRSDPSSAATQTPRPDSVRQTSDVNSSVASERAHILRQHPLDDPRDVVVGGRLFGETLSTRSFGDAHYKLPVRERREEQQLDHRQVDGGGNPGVVAGTRLSARERKLHRHYVERMSARLLAATQDGTREKAVQDGGSSGGGGGGGGGGSGASATTTPPQPRHGATRTLTLEERYDAMFSSYHTPPYVSAVPDVQVWSEAAPRSSVEDVAGDDEHPDGRAAARCEDDVSGTRGVSGTRRSMPRRRMLGIMATDGLWDLVSSEEAVAFLQRTTTVAGRDGEKNEKKEVANLAESLLRYVVEEKGRKPGDDITILVVEYDVSGWLDV
ncbi:pyruvate dehydrogenase phosphatase [Microdochium nivale]|nr:pyruvate dehydrogenase phosphatase [Microdochium nivale]